MRQHKLQLPIDLLMLLRVVAMSEILGARLDLDFRLFEFATPYLNNFWIEQHSPQAIARRVGRFTLAAAQLGLDLSRRTTQLLNRHDLDDFENKMERMINRLALSILLAAVILSLELLMLVFHPSGWEQYAGWVFAFAFLVALGFGAWLM